jgi:hypothetical protein
MDLLTEPQELVGRFNEDEAVCRECESLRRLRRRFRLGMAIPNSRFDRIVGMTMERKHRVVRCIDRALS